MITAGFKSIMSDYETGYDRHIFNEFFIDIEKIMKKHSITNYYLVTDRLYRRYVRNEDFDATFELMQQVKQEVIRHAGANLNAYNKYYETFYRACEQFIYCRDGGRLSRSKKKLRTGIVTLPYSVEEQLLPDKFYDELPDDAEPIWMRMVPAKEFVHKYSQDKEILAIVDSWDH